MHVLSPEFVFSIICIISFTFGMILFMFGLLNIFLHLSSPVFFKCLKSANINIGISSQWS